MKKAGDENHSPPFCLNGIVLKGGNRNGDKTDPAKVEVGHDQQGTL
jgi:hypothetical protein